MHKSIECSRRGASVEAPPPLGAVVIDQVDHSQTLTPDLSQSWAHIRAGHGVIGYESEYISVVAAPRRVLSTHPWSFGAADLTALRQRLEETATCRLEDVVSAVGSMAVLGDDVFLLGSAEAVGRSKLPPEFIAPVCEGELAKDWFFDTTLAIYPYDNNGDYRSSPAVGRYLWKFRSLMAASAIRQERHRRWDVSPLHAT